MTYFLCASITFVPPGVTRDFPISLNCEDQLIVTLISSVIKKGRLNFIRRMPGLVVRVRDFKNWVIWFQDPNSYY